MKVFISWSGARSRELAVALSDWFPKVLQHVEPWVSSASIPKGANWITELNAGLADCNFAVVCLTAENRDSLWLNYESGAISSAIQARVCPVLLDLEPAEVRAPLSHFQVTKLTVEEVTSLMESMHSASAGNPRVDVAAAVQQWWPGLEHAIDQIPDNPPAGAGTAAAAAPDQGASEPAPPEVSLEDRYAEVLTKLQEIEFAVTASHMVSPVGTRAAQIGEHLFGLAKSLGLGAPIIASRTRSVLVLFDDALPEPLPDELYGTCQAASTQLEGTIYLLSKPAGRDAVEFRMGTCSEPPF